MDGQFGYYIEVSIQTQTSHQVRDKVIQIEGRPWDCKNSQTVSNLTKNTPFFTTCHSVGLIISHIHRC